ncbi:MAG: hypothetical protein QGG55_01955, partial [Verrucomicrobiota bacterium]|nr:hypothetical protein [Verrucomicrobiota bacterium]
MDSIIAFSGVMLGLFLSYMVFFVADLTSEMPVGVRLLLFGTAAGSTMYFAWFWLNHWVINKRGSHDLANLVQKRYHKLGDRLLGIVELADTKTAPAYASEGLRKAAIAQVASEAADFDFRKVVATRKSKLYFVGALLIASLLALPAVWMPAISQNKAQRLANPVGEVERLTLAEVAEEDVDVNRRIDRNRVKAWFPLPKGGAMFEVEGADGRTRFIEIDGIAAKADDIRNIFLVPSGEKSRVQSRFQADPFVKRFGQWRAGAMGFARDTQDFLSKSISVDTDIAGVTDQLLPNTLQATIHDARSSQTVGLKNVTLGEDGRLHGELAFELEGRTDHGEVTIDLVDAERKIFIQPISRPKLNASKTARVEYPEYLSRETTRREAGGLQGLPQGSRVTFEVASADFRGLTGAGYWVSAKVTRRDTARLRDVLYDMAADAENRETWVEQLGLPRELVTPDNLLRLYLSQLPAEDLQLLKDAQALKPHQLVPASTADLDKQARQMGVPEALLTAEVLNSVQPGKLALTSPSLEIEPWHHQLVLSSSRYSQRIRTLPLPLGNSNNATLQVTHWKDEFELASKKSDQWTGELKLVPDKKPEADWTNWHDPENPQVRTEAIIVDRTFPIPVFAEDDLGLYELRLRWSATKTGEEQVIKRGEVKLADGDPYTTRIDHEYLFVPRVLGLDHGTDVTMQLVARDYHFHKDGRQHVSQPFYIRIVTAAEHAKIIQEKFKEKLAELDDVVRDQEGLIDRGRNLKNSDDLNSK